MADWRVALLKRIGAKPTKANLRFLDTWQRWEGGHTKNDARFNWLNTTRDAPGAVASINSVGVKAFDSFEHGINALAQTLMNGRYDDLVAGLTAGDPYSFDVSAGLQTWVSGRPDGNPGYAQKILGGKAGSKHAPSPGAPPPASGGGLVKPESLQGPSWDWTMDFVFGDSDPEFAELMKGLNEDAVAPQAVAPEQPGAPGSTGSAATLSGDGKLLQLSTDWKGTHITDGLDLNNGKATARDIMAPVGTKVGAPEDGVIVDWSPTGAQQGGRIWFRSNSGHWYWIGHLTNGLKAGTKVKRGQPIALVGAHDNGSHVHIDRYYGKGDPH